jgi:hypothetical protein
VHDARRAAGPLHRGACCMNDDQREALRRGVLSDLAWVEQLVDNYRRSLEGVPSSTGLVDLEYAVAGIRKRIEKAKAGGIEENAQRTGAGP